MNVRFSHLLLVLTLLSTSAIWATSQSDARPYVSAPSVARTTVTFRDAKTNAIIKTWKTNEGVKITVVGSQSPYSIILVNGIGDQCGNYGNLGSGQSLTIYPDGNPPGNRWLFPVSVSVLTPSRYPVASLERHG